MRRLILTCFIATFLVTAEGVTGPPAQTNRVRERIVGLPCEGCEAVFEGLPDALTSHSRIAPPDEPGEPMRIEGTVRDLRGRPAPGVIVYAYQTDARGIYPAREGAGGRASLRHGQLRGWAKTNERGRYRFDTIRPASYPNTDIPAHVHMHVIEAGRGTYYIDDLLFDDDPRLTPRRREQMTAGRGGPGIARPRRTADSVWIVTRDIILGKSIPSYPATKP